MRRLVRVFTQREPLRQIRSAAARANSSHEKVEFCLRTHDEWLQRLRDLSQTLLCFYMREAGSKAGSAARPQRSSPRCRTIRSVQPAKSEKSHKFLAGTFDTDSTVAGIVSHWSGASLRLQSRTNHTTGEFVRDPPLRGIPCRRLIRPAAAGHRHERVPGEE